MELKKQQNKQKGFTLIEIAIVMVIIGLLLGGVLKGQELINNAKIKGLYSLKDQMSSAYNTYYDRYNAFPGDDENALATFGGTVANGDGDGQIEDGPTYNCITIGNGDEDCAAFEHLRAASLISGSGTANPKNPYGGSVAVYSDSLNSVNGTWVSFDNLPEDTSQILDRKYDDGVWNTGTIQGSSAYNGSFGELYMLM